MTTDGRAQWSASRFLATLGYFGEVPFLGSFRWMQQLMGHSPVVTGMSLSQHRRTVLIISPGTGAHKGDTAYQMGSDSTPGVNMPDVLRALQDRLAGDVTLVFYPEDPSQEDPSQIDPSQMDPSGVTPETTAKRASKPSPMLSQLVSEADTVVVFDAGSLPTLIAALSAGLTVSDESGSTASGKTSAFVEQCVFDFASPDCELSAWGSLDDVVMGGVSQGNFFLREEASEETTFSGPDIRGQVAVFAGRTSTDNSGGFASVRTRNFEPPFDFSGWRGVRLRVNGDGQRYKFIARNSGGWDSPAYIYSFDTVANTWTDIEIPFEALVATFRARSVPNAPAFDPQRVFSFQLMLSKFEYDRQLNPKFSAGPFELMVSKMSVYRARQGVPLVVVGAGDEAARGQQQAALHEAQINYRFIEPGGGDVVDAIAQALS